MVRSPGAGSGSAVFTLTGGIGTSLQSNDSRMNLPRRVGDDETGCAASASTLT